MVVSLAHLNEFSDVHLLVQCGANDMGVAWHVTPTPMTFPCLLMTFINHHSDNAHCPHVHEQVPSMTFQIPGSKQPKVSHPHGVICMGRFAGRCADGTQDDALTMLAIQLEGTKSSEKRMALQASVHQRLVGSGFCTGYRVLGLINLFETLIKY